MVYRFSFPNLPNPSLVIPPSFPFAEGETGGVIEWEKGDYQIDVADDPKFCSWLSVEFILIG